MKKPNLDDYDRGHRDYPVSLLYPGEFYMEDKQTRALRRRALFIRLWMEREDADGHHYSALSGKRLPEKFSTLYFDHLLERSKYPELEFEEENIIIILPDEHQLKTNGNPLPKHKILIEKAKERFKV
jgi:hypothetical protein